MASRAGALACKFTPLGFETAAAFALRASFLRVNLPRWGLKLKIKRTRTTLEKVCKFTPLGFETLKKAFW